jgi:soluble lytic murein transglycosylase-like protein
MLNPALHDRFRLLAFLVAIGATVPARAETPATLDLSAYRLGSDVIVRPAAPEPVPAAAPEPRQHPGVSTRLAGMPFAKLIEGAAREASLDPALVHAVISVESGYNPAARSPKGALGLMQVLPATALRYGIHNAARSPAANLRAGTLYLSDLMVLFDQRLELVLAAYNAGEAAVLRYGQRIPPFRETQQYVPAVLARYFEWREPPPRVEKVIPPAPAARTRIIYMPGTLLENEFPHLTTGLR